MSWLTDIFSPPAQNVQLPQFGPAPQLPGMPQAPGAPSAPGQVPGMYGPTGQQGAEANWLGGIGNLGNFNMYGANLGQAQGIAGGMVNSPWASPFMQGAQTAGAMGQQGAMGAFGAGGSLYGLGGSIAGSAFDPQSALYNRTAQQVQDQTRAAQSARGIATTPYGAGLENQAMSNFNIDWQNQQLQRQIQGGQAAGSLFGQGAGLQAGAPGQYLTASGLPYATQQGIGQQQLGTLGALGQFGAAGGTQNQQQLADYQNYMQWAGGAQGNQLAAYNAQLGGQQTNYNQQLALYNAMLQGQGQQANQQTNIWQGQNQQQLQAFNSALAQERQASSESQAMWGGLGNLAGAGSRFLFPGGFNMSSPRYGFGAG